MPQTLKALKVAINRRIINKIEKGDRKSFAVLTREFENIETTLPELADIINAGHPFCAQHRDSRKNENFTGSDVLAVDIDHGITLAEALASEFVQDYAGFTYTTPSHTAERQRFRIVFQTERTIADAEEMTAAYQGLIRKFGGDEACKDACRAFYGSKGSNPIVLGNVLPNDQLDQLITLGRDPVSVADNAGSNGKGKSYSIAARRSGVTISRDHPVSCANGQTMAFEDVPFSENVHCPVHLDRNPSAFVVKSKEGSKGVYCHSCAATFWMTSPKARLPLEDFDFYRTERIIREMEYEQDPGSYYDEDEVPPGFIALANSQRSVRTMSQKFLSSDDLPIYDGVTLICSEKASGKSQLLFDKVQQFVADGKSVVLIGHRMLLLENLARRLGLVNYIFVDDGKFKNNQPTRQYAICVDSMSKLLKPKRDKYDVVILDESEQIFAHLTGGTLKDNRRASYQHLFHYLAVAKSVIVADADLAAITIEGIYQAMGPETAYHFHLNEHREGKHSQGNFYHYANEEHLTQEMMGAIGAGGRFYIATNSITKADELQAAIRSVHGGGPRIMLVTSKTARIKEVQHFVSNIKTEILNYDVVIASPTLGTGIDITFPDAAKNIDTVYGFFVTQVNTHFDCDQQLARVRHPKAVKVWISPNRFSFETEPEVIMREAESNGMLNDILIGIKRDGSTELDQTYLNVYAHVTSIARASKNNLRKNLLDLRARNGWNIVHVDIDMKASELGKIVKGVAKVAVENQRVGDICSAEKLSSNSYLVLQESTSILTKEEDDAMRRYEIESFYGENATPGLLALDKKGAYRSQLSMLEIYLSPTDRLATKDSRESELMSIVTDRKKRTLKQLMLKNLLTNAGLADDEKPIKPDVVISSEDLKSFVQFWDKNAASLESLFGMTTRDDLHEKPMSSLGIVMKKIGLPMQNFKTKKVGKDKIYLYRIHPEYWKNAAHYMRNRLPKTDPAMKFLTF